MGKRPIYMRQKHHPYIVLLLLVIVIAWGYIKYHKDVSLQFLVEQSELKGRVFQGKTEEIIGKKSGVKAFFMEQSESPLVAISFIFDKAGSAYDPEDKQGLASVAALSLIAGTGEMSAEKLQDEMRLNGIEISFSADRDVFSGKFTAPKEKIDQGIRLLKSIIATPQFNKKYVDATKKSLIASLDAEKEDPQQVLGLALNRRLYGDHVYGRHPIGKKENISLVTHYDLRQFVSKNFDRSNLFVGITGNLDRREAINLIDDIFGVLPQGSQRNKLKEAPLHLSGVSEQLFYDGGQNMAVYAAQGTCRRCADFYPLYMANYLFGGAGLNSRLNRQLREKEGLTYGAYAVLENEDCSNLLYMGFSATPEHFQRASELFEQEWQKAAQGFTEEELQSAKNYLTASYHLRFASTGNIADMLAYIQKQDLGLDFLQKRNYYVEGVTLKQLNEAAAKYFGKEVLVEKIGVFEKGENK